LGLRAALSEVVLTDGTLGAAMDTEGATDDETATDDTTPGFETSF
jgi:hypothetical protein